ncbi:P-type ATPase (P-ATPase) Superfamily [Trachipleistophora hominis]|uniref:P-type ATPase (P-ATPase) Superfamily n=1 Tax=Trachipleistophora hominis TaxID=72359 RepID=L7JS35_TRAHO|nr:P-type ATPase (P-ATPase) Superfamily [Trachipleistophora hominis]
MSNTYNFLKIDAETFCTIAESGDITCDDKFKNIEDVGIALHRDLHTGALLEIGEIAQLNDNERADHARKKQIYAQESKRMYGVNEIVVDDPRSITCILRKNMRDRILILLFIASAVSLIVGIYNTLYENEPYSYIEGLSILLAVVIIVAVSTATEYTQEQLFKSLESKKADLSVKYVEDGVFNTKKISEILVGDMLYVEPGDILPADAVLVSNDTLFVDESMLTGESNTMEKNMHMPVLRAGSYVQEGAARCLVIAVGYNSTKGKLLRSMVRPARKTALEKKSEQLANQLATRALIVCFLFFCLHIVKIYVLEGPYTLTYVVRKVIETIALAVMIIPEGLPMATTMALSFGTKRMLKDNNLVRDIAACERMNNVRYLCTDKTGTLTYNRLRLRNAYVKRKSLANASLVKSIFDVNDADNYRYIVHNIVFNSSAFKNREGVYVGSRLESTLLALLVKTGVDVSVMRKKSHVLRRLCFSSERKYMATIIEDVGVEMGDRPSQRCADGASSNDNEYNECSARSSTDQSTICTDTHSNADPGTGPNTVSPVDSNKNRGTDLNTDHNTVPTVDLSAHIGMQISTANDTNETHKKEQKKRQYVALLKGATEQIVKYCQYEIIDGNKVEIDRLKITKYLKKQDKLCKRTIAMAYAHVLGYESTFVQIDQLPGLVFLGCFSFEDPLREGIDQKIEVMKDAGLNIVMLTGDGLESASYIAEEIGILDGKYEAITGKCFKSMSDDELMNRIENIRVIARATPIDKQRFVDILQRKGETVAVTGDGANDGPALKLADVGFSMGMSSTDIAKEASSVVVLDENFESIIRAIAWGRCINDSIRKFLQLQLTVTVCTVVLMAVSSLFTFEQRGLFTPLQLLWINLYMDAFSAISLSTDKPTAVHLSRKPEHPDNPLITRYMKHFVFFSTLYILMVTLFMYYTSFGQFLNI